MSSEPFTTLTSVAAPLPDDDVDTDVIFPARFLTLTVKRGLGRYAFHDKRFDAEGVARGTFALDTDPWRGARIVVVGANFGCGSSREQAPWALADLGIRCIVGAGFGAIFEANCLRNGLLPIRLVGEAHRRAMAAAQAGHVFTVDLEQRVVGFDDATIAFVVDVDARLALLEGRDEIDTILHDASDAIARFRAAQRERMPWLYEHNDRGPPWHSPS